MTARYVHTIWCDDIRQELGNKPSFMGVYTGGIVIDALPIILPRLSVVSWIVTPKEAPFKRIGIRVVRDDGIVMVAVEQANPENGFENSVGSRSGSARQVIMAAMNIAGVELPENCKYLTIFVDTESETLEGSKLHVEVNPAAVALVNAATQGRARQNTDPSVVPSTGAHGDPVAAS